MSEIVLKSSISSQTWDCDVLGCKKNHAVNPLPLERGLAVQTRISNYKADANEMVT